MAKFLMDDGSTISSDKLMNKREEPKISPGLLIEIELVDTNNYDFGAKGKYTLKYTLVNETEIPDKSWGWCYELIESRW